MFKRRDKRPWWEVAARMVWPRGGWGRALGYMTHRIRRLPDSPEKIGRGIFAGTFISFTPLYGMHFILAAAMARLMRGNVLAALLATFVGNPLTYLPIAMVSMKLGHLILGRHSRLAPQESLGQKFALAWQDLWRNMQAIFTGAQADWHGLTVFYHDIFLPFLVGGIVPGALAGLLSYYLSVPVIRAYQNRRRRALAAKLEKRLAARRAAKGEKP